MNRLAVPLAAVLLLLGGCASPVPPPQASAMVPKAPAALPGGIAIYVERPTLESAAKSGEAPFDAETGTFPFVQPQGIDNYRDAIRLTLAAAGARADTAPNAASYVLHTAILGGMAIPEAYAIFYVHYRLADPATGQTLWSKNIYSQAKLEMTGSRLGMMRVGGVGVVKTADPAAYDRLAAANLRQMTEALAAWVAIHGAAPNE